MEVKQECRFCDELGRHLRQGKEWFRCQHGRFDTVVPRYFAWSGIRQPNKTVAAAQKDCPYFKVHPK